MKKFLSILAGSIVTVLIATSFTPATAGMNWNDVWGALKNGGVKQPTPEPSTPPPSDSSSSSGSSVATDPSTTPSNGDSGLTTNDNSDTDYIQLE